MQLFTLTPVKVPFVTPNGDPVLPGDSLTDLWTAIATGKFAIPGTASDPVTSEIRAVLAKHLNQAQTPSHVTGLNVRDPTTTPTQQPS
jgi:hypothetical protein